MAVALVLAGLPTACGGGDADDPPDIQLTVLSPDRDRFPHVPGASIVAYPGDEVDVRLAGFEPDEEVRVFTHLETYDRLAYRADSEGVVTFPVHISASDDVAAHFFAVAQEPHSEPYGKFATFLIVVPGHEYHDEPQFDVLTEANALISPATP